MTRFVVYHIYRKPKANSQLVTGNMGQASSSLTPQLGQMQLVFKCGRVNEHKAKTSHHLAGFLELLAHDQHKSHFADSQVHCKREGLRGT